MQYDSFMEVYDTVALSPEQPVHPVGELFTYHPSRTPAALHYHNFLELGYCEHGSGVFIVDGEVVPFSGKCTSVIYEGQTHIAQSVSQNKSLWHFLYIDLNHLFSDSQLFALDVVKSLHFRNYEFENLLAYEQAPEMYELTRMIMNEAAAGGPEALPALRGLVYTLLLYHGRRMTPRSAPVRDKQMKLLDEVGHTLNYINVHYREDITMDALVKVSQSSKASLQRKFMAVTGFTPIRYLHHLRLKRATVMLRGENKTIMEIAMEVGYNSLSSFNRMFLKTYGMSPSQWRRQNVEGHTGRATA